MAVNYNVVKRQNPQDRTQPAKYYASLKSKGTRDLRFVAQRIADKSSLNVIDVKGVLEGLLQVLPKILDDGYGVALDEFGRFSLTVSSKPSETAEEVTSSNISKINLKFRAHALLQDQLNNAKFKKVASESSEEAEE